MAKNDSATVVRYKENPFIKELVVPVGKQNVRVSRLGKDDNILVNQATGEVHGTHVTAYRKVDKEEFVKLFTRNIALTFDLKAAGIKAFNVLLWSMQKKAMEKDLVPLDKWVLEEFLEDANDGRDPFPTGVGMNRHCNQAIEKMYAVPHRRGDEPCSFVSDSNVKYRSPQAWG